MIGLEHQNGYHAGYEQRKRDEDKYRCYWSYNDDGFWEGECGAAWEFTTGGPAKNRFKFCFKCGHRIKSYEPGPRPRRSKK